MNRGEESGSTQTPKIYKMMALKPLPKTAKKAICRVEKTPGRVSGCQGPIHAPGGPDRGPEKSSKGNLALLWRCHSNGSSKAQPEGGSLPLLAYGGNRAAFDNGDVVYKLGPPGCHGDKVAITPLARPFSAGNFCHKRLVSDKDYAQAQPGRFRCQCDTG